MTTPADIADAVLAEREACVKAIKALDPLAALADWDDTESIVTGVQKQAIDAIRSHPTPAPLVEQERGWDAVTPLGLVTYNEARRIAALIQSVMGRTTLAHRAARPA